PTMSQEVTEHFRPSIVKLRPRTGDSHLLTTGAVFLHQKSCNLPLPPSPLRPPASRSVSPPPSRPSLHCTKPLFSAKTVAQLPPRRRALPKENHPMSPSPRERPLASVDELKARW